MPEFVPATGTGRHGHPYLHRPNHHHLHRPNRQHVHHPAHAHDGPAGLHYSDNAPNHHILSTQYQPTLRHWSPYLRRHKCTCPTHRCLRSLAVCQSPPAGLPLWLPAPRHLPTFNLTTRSHAPSHPPTARKPTPGEPCSHCLHHKPTPAEPCSRPAFHHSQAHPWGAILPPLAPQAHPSRPMLPPLAPQAHPSGAMLPTTLPPLASQANLSGASPPSSSLTLPLPSHPTGALNLQQIPAPHSPHTNSISNLATLRNDYISLLSDLCACVHVKKKWRRKGSHSSSVSGSNRLV